MCEYTGPVGAERLLTPTSTKCKNTRCDNRSKKNLSENFLYSNLVKSIKQFLIVQKYQVLPYTLEQLTSRNSSYKYLKLYCKGTSHPSTILYTSARIEPVGSWELMRRIAFMQQLYF